MEVWGRYHSEYDHLFKLVVIEAKGQKSNINKFLKAFVETNADAAVTDGGRKVNKPTPQTRPTSSRGKCFFPLIVFTDDIVYIGLDYKEKDVERNGKRIRLQIWYDC